ncbi:thioesterase II family protein [Paenibacillus sp. 481]|uniref:thioesterase II family protein n=1 Tax=Paenibacillus sp. 481 TaxID=2835869 RepID=UPI001E31B309|nr:alpha/beta fold hydrolase [Paenibacillus sp. 481]UHA74009.1 thioesterase [Paenibacillus sp. 481]
MKYKLFCVPYAGGSATCYTRWKRYLNESIELHPLEPAGRGRRMADPLSSSMDEMVEDLLGRMKQELDDSEFMLFGHSMGAFVAHELAQAIKRETGREPAHLFVSGVYPPHAVKSYQIHTLSDEQLWQEIKRLGGTADELFQREELKRMFMPVLRRDMQVVETYRPKDVAPLQCDISVLYAEDDVATEWCVIDEWSRYGSQDCRIYKFTGGHFFINVHTPEVVSIVNEAVRMPTKSY